MTGAGGQRSGAPVGGAGVDEVSEGSTRFPSRRPRRRALLIAIAASILAGVSIGAWFQGGERLRGGGGGNGLPVQTGKRVTVGVHMETRDGGEVTLIRARIARPDPALNVSIAAVYSPSSGVGQYVDDIPFSLRPVRGIKVYGQGERFESWSKMWLALSFSTDTPGAYAFEDVDVTYRDGRRIRTARLSVSVCYLAVTPEHYDAVVADLGDRDKRTPLEGSVPGLTRYKNDCKEIA